MKFSHLIDDLVTLQFRVQFHTLIKMILWWS